MSDLRKLSGAVYELARRLTRNERQALVAICKGEQPDDGAQGVAATLINAFLVDYQFNTNRFTPTLMGKQVVIVCPALDLLDDAA